VPFARKRHTTDIIEALLSRPTQIPGGRFGGCCSIAGRHSEPDFLALLHGRHVPTCVYCFDLLELNGRDLRGQPLVQRRARLRALLRRTKCDLLRFSDSFPDADALLAECSRRGLEGIVAKRKDASNRSGTRSGWIKGQNFGMESGEPGSGEAL
jgi:hypothetical protein